MQNTIPNFALSRLRFSLSLVLGCIVLAFFNPTQAQSSTATLQIETSAICGMCKTRLETELGFLRGIKSAELNLDTKELTVVYKTNKLKPDSIRAKIASLGYRADMVPAEPKAFEALPACCQAEGLHHP
jgi:copper chaperone CopZ